MYINHRYEGNSSRWGWLLGKFFCFLSFQILMNVPGVTCVWVGCVPTQKDPSFAPDVRLATECLWTSRAVKVNSIPSCASHWVEPIRAVKDLTHFASALWNCLCCATGFPLLLSYVNACVLLLRHRWVPVHFYMRQWNLPKLWGLVLLWALPRWVQSFAWRGILQRFDSLTCFILNADHTC